MAGILGLFNIGRLALAAEERALSVTSHNIANASTAGYARQRPELQATLPINGNPGQIGTGVEVAQIRRQVDQFVENQLTSQSSTLGRLQTDARLLSRLEATFNDLQGAGLNEALDDFFAAVQDVANNPQSAPERVALLERARTLGERFASAAQQLEQIRSDANQQVAGAIDQVNALAQQIADLNRQISQAELSGQNANDLRDERGRAVNQLAELVAVRTFENAQSQLTVMVGGGYPLVEGINAYTLRGVPDPDNSGMLGVRFETGTGLAADLSAAVVGDGQLKALLDLRDSTIPGTLSQLDALAAALVSEFNAQHTAGFGLDGSTGLAFFSPLAPSAMGASTNTGSGSVSVAVATPTALSYDYYDLTFAGGNYTLLNRATGASVTGAYANPTTVAFEGLSVTISGAPAAGDAFSLSSHRGAAGSLALSLTDPNQVAASATNAGLPGNNSNALQLAQIQEKAVSGLGGVSVQSAYAGLTSEVGARVQAAQRRLAAEEIIQQQLSQAREEVSGVSLDEELTNLLKFQRAYEAAARIITTADELYQTILGLKR